MKYDLSDVSFLIPFKKDSEERVRNLDFVLKYLKTYFKTTVYIMEQDFDQKYFLSDEYKNDSDFIVDYSFVKADSYLFHRTKLLNDMAKKSTTPIISIYDLDVIFKIDQYIVSRDLIKSKTYDVVYPYNGKFINFSDDKLQSIFEKCSVDHLKETDGNCYHNASVGGAIFYNKDVFFKCGMENEKFMSWGAEDNYRLEVVTKFGYKVTRIGGILCHMYHPTSENSSNTKHQAYFNNQNEYYKVCNMTKQQLEEYIKTFTWTK